MQKDKLPFFKDRSVFSVTFPIREYAQKGERLFESDPVYLFFDKLPFKFLQMPLFAKQDHELETRFGKWLYFFKNPEELDHIPAILDEPVFQKAFHTAELLT